MFTSRYEGHGIHTYFDRAECRFAPEFEKERENMIQLSGQEVRRLMRVHKKPIGGLSLLMRIPQKRVRHVRAQGVSGEAFVIDWLGALCA